MKNVKNKQEYKNALCVSNTIAIDEFIKNAIPQKLYRYFKLSEKAVASVEKNTLWYSQPHYFNDPYDSTSQKYYPLCKFNLENALMYLYSNLTNRILYKQIKNDLVIDNYIGSKEINKYCQILKSYVQEENIDDNEHIKHALNRT